MPESIAGKHPVRTAPPSQLKTAAGNFIRPAPLKTALKAGLENFGGQFFSNWKTLPPRLGTGREKACCKSGQRGCF
jgi:hypothetical protein